MKNLFKLILVVALFNQTLSECTPDLCPKNCCNEDAECSNDYWDDIRTDCDTKATLCDPNGCKFGCCVDNECGTQEQCRGDCKSCSSNCCNS